MKVLASQPEKSRSAVEGDEEEPLVKAFLGAPLRSSAGRCHLEEQKTKKG